MVKTVIVAAIAAVIVLTVFRKIYKDYKKNKNYYCDNNHVYIYDLLSGNIVKIIKKTIIGYPKLGTDNYIITNNNIYICILKN